MVAMTAAIHSFVHPLSRRLTGAGALLLLFLGCVHSGQLPWTKSSSSSVQAAVSNPAQALSVAPVPGLAVIYVTHFMERHLDQLPSGPALAKKGTPGKPIAFLNHRFDNSPVFGSGQNQGVGMELNGLIRLATIGPYRFKALSNDGLRVYIGGHLILNDPDVHGDRFCGPATLSVDQAGWYDIKVRYFQRKGTAAISLQWQVPGDQDFVPVPAEAYGHTGEHR